MRRRNPCRRSPPSVSWRFASVFAFIRQQDVCLCVIHGVTDAPVSRVHGGSGAEGRNCRDAGNGCENRKRLEKNRKLCGSFTIKGGGGSGKQVLSIYLSIL